MADFVAKIHLSITTCNHVRRADSRRVLWQSFSRGEEWYVELARAPRNHVQRNAPLRTEEIVKNDFVKIDKLSYLLRGTGRIFLSRKGGGGRHDNHKIFAGFGSKGREEIRGMAGYSPGHYFV